VAQTLWPAGEVGPLTTLNVYVASLHIISLLGATLARVLNLTGIVQLPLAFVAVTVPVKGEPKVSQWTR
jgi:hypothetical protein